MPDSPVHHAAVALKLSGPLDEGALRRCLTRVVRRHESLRTSIVQEDGRPTLHVRRRPHYGLDRIDLTHLPATERQARAVAVAAEESARPFNLSYGPLVRGSLLTLAPSDHLLLLTIHRLVADDASVRTIVRELGVLYEAFQAGRPSPLSKLPLQYADFAAWQHCWLKEDEAGRQLTYWRERLAGAPGALELPTDRPRPAVQRFVGGRHPFCVGRELSERLRVLSQRSGVTLFVSLLAVFTALLHRYTGQRELLVGTPVSGRTRRELEGLVGVFLNTLVLRADLGGDPSFRELLRRLGVVTREALAHQELPFERLVEELQPERDLSRTPLFQVMFTLAADEVAAWRAADLELRRVPLDVTACESDLALTMVDTTEGLWGSVEYSTDLFEAASIERLVGHFERLLAGAVAAPERRLSELALLGEAEAHELLVAWNATGAAYPRTASLAALVEAQVARTPEAEAVAFERRTLSYGELNRRANRLAHRLRRLGVRPEGLVGICVERSLELVVGLLGILKAGGAYLPLDPDYPPERLRFMLEDAGARVILTQGSLLSRVRALAPEVLCLDEAWALAERDDNPPPLASALNVAYVTYTSGSTGIPKGVAITQQGVLRLLCNNDYADISPSDVFLQLAPIAFDASTFEIWAPLLHGARLVVAPPQSPSIDELGRLLRDQRITILWLTAGLFHEMVDANPDGLASVSTILAGGDVVFGSHVRRLLNRSSRCTVVNGYGPTESTTFACCHRMHRDDQIGPSIPIGRPIKNTRVYVLDAGMAAVPIGAQGELFIAGDGLARGYHHRPDLTAERFLPDPFGPPGERMYRTGDLVRYRADGRLEFIGRLDSQVKIRGFRVEIGEVEAALRMHPAVRSAVVLARVDAPSGKRLVSYVVLEPGTGATIDELRRHLRSSLPEYMMPADFVELDALPLTENGKIDRRALPAPERGRAAGPRSAPPRTPVETVVARVWAEVLGLEAVGVHDNFFELGGDSLLSLQILARLTQAGITLTPRDVFERQTIAELAGTVVASPDGEPQARPSELAIVRRAGDTMPLSFAQQRLWFMEQLSPGTAVHNLPVALELTGPLRVDVLEQSLHEVALRHGTLRTTFPSVDGTPVQRIDPHSDLRLPVVDISELAPTERDARLSDLMSADSSRAFDLTRGPLVRASLLRLAEERHVLLINMHHMVSDGWSIDRLLREVEALYAAFCEGNPSPLAALPVQYADFAVWQREWLSGRVLHEQLAYWRECLRGSMPTEIPGDHPRPREQSFKGALESRAMADDLTAGLRALGRREGVTLFMLLAAAFTLLLHRYSGAEDIVIGVPSAARNRPELEGLIGFFINTLVFRTNLSGDPTFEELLGRVRDAAAGAFGHQDVPFDRLVEELHPERDLSRNPLFQVMFNMYDFRLGELRLPDVRCRALTPPPPGSLFDLTLYAREEGDRLSFDVVYNPDLLDGPRIVELLNEMVLLLEQAVEASDRRISEFQLVTPAARPLLPDPAAPLARGDEEPLVERIAGRTWTTPQAVAVEDERGRWSYEQLDARARQLAGYLGAHELGPGALVAIFAPRSKDLVWAMLGVLKAGAAFLILDPAYPPARLVAQMAEARPKAWIAIGAGTLAPEIEHFISESVMRCRLDVPLSIGAGNPLAPFPVHQEPAGAATVDTLAYVAFTSGSTGRPKGILGPQRPLCHFLRWHADSFGLRASDRFTLLSGLGYDPLLRDVFAPLWVGATLAIPSPSLLASPVPMVDWMADQRITVTHLTPVMGRLLHLGSAPGDRPRTRLRELRYVFFGGDVLTADDVRHARSLAPNATLVNFYGTTETPQAMGVHVVAGAADDLALPPILPVGRGIADAQLLVLTAHGALAGVAELGELHVRSPHLSAGYLRDEQQTGERFVINPFSGLRDDRLYRTGDLARYGVDGSVVVCGRRDDQVKIRGFRVELGEVESTLRQHPEVRDAAAILVDDGDGEKRLVAYLVVRGTPAPDLAQLRRFLQHRLPEYMLPAGVVCVDAIPVTPNGKIDRRALPPAPSPSAPDRRGAPPASGLQATVASIWQDVLHIGAVGSHHNFFDLGGNSLAMVQVHDRLQRALKREISIVELFRYPDIQSLAGYLNNEQGKSPLDVAMRRIRARAQAAAGRGHVVHGSPAVNRGIEEGEEES